MNFDWVQCWVTWVTWVEMGGWSFNKGESLVVHEPKKLVAVHEAVLGWAERHTLTGTH